MKNRLKFLTKAALLTAVMASMLAGCVAEQFPLDGQDPNGTDSTATDGKMKIDLVTRTPDYTRPEAATRTGMADEESTL
jgi:hypothetical protein